MVYTQLHQCQPIPSQKTRTHNQKKKNLSKQKS